MKQLTLISFLFLFSCSDSYELKIEPETNDVVKNQKYHFNFNGKVSFPTGKISKSFDPETDKFEVIKIKYIPLKKWKKTGVDDNEWGQAGIRVRIIRNSGIFTSEETILDRVLMRFYNPNISNISELEKSHIRQINPDLDSGLGTFSDNNSFYYIELNNIPFNKIYLENSQFNYYNSLVLKKSPIVSTNLNTLISKATSDDNTKLAVLDLSRCTLVYPYNAARYEELKNF